MAAFLMITGCSKQSPREQENTSTGGSVTISDDTVHQLPMPKVPATLATPEDRASYLAAHFWDGMDWSDSSLVSDTAFMEQNFANFIQIASMTDENSVKEAMGHLVKGATADSLSAGVIISIAEKYLYNPNSPMKDEGAYIAFAEALLDCQSINLADRERTRWRLEASRKNRPGATAPDFEFIRPDGRHETLKSWIHSSGAGSNMLIFYEPGCESCDRILGSLASSNELNEAITAGEIAVLAVYPDEDIDSWRATAPSLPRNWTVARDAGSINERELYILPAMPTIYLIDDKGTILVKDMRVE